MKPPERGYESKVRTRDKGKRDRWNRAAKKGGMPFNEWAIRALDYAAANLVFAAQPKEK